MSETRTVHVRIEGRVQGVGFRAWVERRALTLGLSGWVRNRYDGAVEAVLHGPPRQVADMLRACEEGPRASRVTRVDVREESGEAYSGFEVRRTE
ncbi:acylphosphatase [Filomicrobium sp.]|uniref:acylphosphatase n=1 Tax=Filomicrobium sp. TaxID=2024831 RepID=UPI002583C628|nr:acylphosphatase [Filomicrobium sp.]MCV0370097.1 acylphosphatase [Filomicrobium sp.]